jgi:hypothetical protein
VSEAPDARFMGYAQLKTYTERLRDSGFDVLEQDVALAGKLAFPFVTIIMTLMAVPFAVLTGRGGAMAAIGIGIGLALTYWITISVFAAMGTGGLVAPLVAAWAPNMLFGSAAVYLPDRRTWAARRLTGQRQRRRSRPPVRSQCGVHRVRDQQQTGNVRQRRKWRRGRHAPGGSPRRTASPRAARRPG